METGNITKEREDIKINQIEILGLIYNKPKKKKKTVERFSHRLNTTKQTLRKLEHLLV